MSRPDASCMKHHRSRDLDAGMADEGVCVTQIERPAQRR
jgi:hypothetical protein